jgi:hypothetical protein
MDSKPLQWAAIAVAFFVGRASGPTASAGAIQAETPSLEQSSNAEAMLAGRLRIAKWKPGPEGCQRAEDIGNVRVYVGSSHYIAKAINPTYPPARVPGSPSEAPPSLWFCAWNQTDPDVTAWYEVPGTLSNPSPSRR